MSRLALAAVACLMLAGCNSSSSPSSSHPAMSPGMTGNMSGTMAPGTTMSPGMNMTMPMTYEVDLQGIAFVNGTLTIHAGDTVKWVHHDGQVGHSVTSDAGAAETFDNYPNCVVGVAPHPVCMTDGESFSYTFKKAGKTSYHCRAHSSMTGTITVV